MFDDDSRDRFDAIVLGTGSRLGVTQFLVAPSTLDPRPSTLEARGARRAARGAPTTSGVRTSLPGLYCCGFYVSPFGMLRVIAEEARAITRAIARQ